MQYPLSTRTTVVGRFSSGASVTITIYDLSTGLSIPLDSNVCTEIANGWFRFSLNNITTFPTVETECLCLMTDGTNDFGNKVVLGGFVDNIPYIPKKVFIDTDAPVNGDGSQASPFNSFNNAKDYCEANNIREMVLAGTATLTTSLKNFTVHGWGVPRIDLNGQDCKNTDFFQCSLSGTYTNSIVARDCYLETGFVTNGAFDNCALQGTIISNPTGQTLLSKCMCGNLDGTPTVFSMNSGLPSLVNISGFSGALTITHCDDVNDKLQVDMMAGILTLDSTNVLGSIVANGNCTFIDQSAGTTVTDYTQDNSKLIGHIYGSQFL